MSTRKRGPLRRLLRIAARIALGVLALVALGLGALAWWLHGEPTERMLARVGEVERVEGATTEIQGAFTITDEALVSTTGLSVRLRTRRPTDPAAASGLTLLILGGLERGRFAVDVVSDPRGHTLASIDYPYDGPRRKIEQLELLERFAQIRQALLDTPAAVMLARKHLAAQGFIDPARIELVGASLGGILGCYAGGLDDGFARVWSLHAGGDLDGLVRRELKRKISFAPLRAALAWIPRYTMGGYGPEHFVARIAPRPYVLICATGDARIPRSAVEALYDAAREPRELIWVEGAHLDGGRPESLEPILAAMFDRLER